MALSTRAALNTLIDSTIDSNGVGGITGAEVNAVMSNLADSTIFQQDWESIPSDVSGITDLDSTDSNFVLITGTETTTHFGSAPAGIVRWFRTSASLPLVHSSALVIPGAANITLAAGSTGMAISMGGDVWRILNLVKADGRPIIPSTIAEIGILDASNVFTVAQSIAITSGQAALTLTLTEAGAATGPHLELYRDSASPAASDFLASIRFLGRDSGGGQPNYATIRAQIVVPTAGSEDGRLTFITSRAGTPTAMMHLDAGLYSDGVTGGDQGAGTLNFASIYQGGVGPLGTAAFQNTGTSGANLPFLNGNNTWSGTNTFTSTFALNIPDFSLVRQDTGVASIIMQNQLTGGSTGNIGQLLYRARDSAGTAMNFCMVRGVILDATDGSEDSTLEFWTNVAGTLAARLNVGGGVWMTGVSGGDKGVGSGNFTTLYQNNSQVLTAGDVGTTGSSIARLNTDPQWTSASFSIIRQATSIESLILGNLAKSNNVDISRLIFRGLDAADNVTDYAIIQGILVTATDGAEDGSIEFRTMVGGTSAKRINIRGGLYTEGVTGNDKGVGTINIGTIYENNVSLADKYAAAVSELFRTLPSNSNGTNVNTAQPWFPATGGVSLEANTTYFFEGLLIVTRAAGTTSHTTSILFGGTATLTSIMFEAIAKNGAGNALAATSAIYATSAAGAVVTPANTDATEHIIVRVFGTVRVNAAGTFIPQYQFSAAPGGTPTTLANSFFRLLKVGNGTVPSNGTWS